MDTWGAEDNVLYFRQMRFIYSMPRKQSSSFFCLKYDSFLTGSSFQTPFYAFPISKAEDLKPRRTPPNTRLLLNIHFPPQRAKFTLFLHPITRPILKLDIPLLAPLQLFQIDFMNQSI